MVVIRSPAAKADHSRWLAAVAGGVHGRNADAGAASTVSCAPLTVIFAPSMASTARTPLSLRSRARSALVTPPGTEAMTSGTTRRVGVAPAGGPAAGTASACPGPRPRPLTRRPLAVVLAATTARAWPLSSPPDPSWPPLSKARVTATAALTATSPARGGGWQ